MPLRRTPYTYPMQIKTDTTMFSGSPRQERVHGLASLVLYSDLVYAAEGAEEGGTSRPYSFTGGTQRTHAPPDSRDTNEQEVQDAYLVSLPPSDNGRALVLDWKRHTLAIRKRIAHCKLKITMRWALASPNSRGPSWAGTCT